MALTQTGGLAHAAPSFPELLVQEGRLFKMPGDRSEGNQSYGCSSQGANSATASTKQAKEEHKSLLTSCNPLPGDLSRGLDTGAGPPTQSLAH